MSVLLDKPDTAGLRFDTHDDALNFAAQLVNDSKDWLAVHDLNIVKRYKEAELEIVFEFRVRPQRDKFHLVFSSIPDVGFGHTKSRPQAGRSGSRNSLVQHRVEKRIGG